MIGCEDCGKFGPDVENPPDGVICIVNIESLEPETRDQFLEVWETDGEAGDCPCAEDRSCSNCGNADSNDGECTLLPDEVFYRNGLCTCWRPDF